MTSRDYVMETLLVYLLIMVSTFKMICYQTPHSSCLADITATFKRHQKTLFQLLFYVIIS